MKYALLPTAIISWIASTLDASASALGEGLAHPWQLNFTMPASPVMERLYDMHNFLLVIITLITLFVLALLVYICVRFNRKANPVPSKVTHNTRLEIIWTVIPILILVVIAIPSLRLHYFMDQVEEAEMTLKVTGYQWYWNYSYPDHGGFNFDSVLIKDADLKPDDHRLLAVDNHVVVPVDTTVHVQMTAADVIHAWAVPAFGVKRDAVPGRLNESWFRATKTGRFFGQCSELCGVGHGFMPIVVDVVSKEEFAQWVATKQEEAGIPIGTTSDDPKKTVLPLTNPVSAEQENPKPVIEKEKEMSKDKASPPLKKEKGEDASFIGEGNQPKPSKAADKVNDNE